MDIFSKLDSLKSIEPSESWVVDAKKKVLSEAPIFERKSILEKIKVNIFGVQLRSFGVELRKYSQSLSFKKLAIPAFSLIFVLSAGVFTFDVLESSLPGEFLYSLKMINEDLALTIASKDKKAEVEMQQVGKRVEEFGRISQNYSDPKQGEKIEMILGEIKLKTNRAEEHLTGIEDNGVKTRVAKVVGAQGEKYTEVLAKTTENLPAVVQDEISEGVAKAINSSEEIYLTSMAVIAGAGDEEEEIIDEAGEEDQEDSVEDGEETVNTEDAEEEPLDDSSDDNDNNSDNGDVMGDEDENSQPDPVDDLAADDISEEDLGDEDVDDIILDEIEKEVITEEVDGEDDETSSNL